MAIDEDRQITTISDHNIIVGRCHMEHDPFQDNRRNRYILNAQKAAVQVEGELNERGESIIWTYSEFMTEMREATKRATRRLKIRNRPILYSEEIKRKTELSRAANRTYRTTEQQNV